MTNLVKGMGLGVTTVAVAVIVVVAFLWVGPGVQSFLGTTSASALYDEQGVVSIYERVSPAVVEINAGHGSGRDLLRMGTGSGFLIDNEGYIVTNNHVIEDAGTVKVKFNNGTAADATIVGRSPANDLALLKVDASLVGGIQPIILGDSSQLKPGQMAIAIGNPFGLEGSVTVGVISQVGRSLPSQLGRAITDIVQTDALINPGNSGGPLLDSNGNVVGINTAIQVSPDGNSRGIGFAVPVNTLTNLLPRLKAEAVVRPVWLGVQANDIDAELAERLGLPVDKGVYVVGVMPNSPAEEAGLMESGLGSRGRPTSGGDIITAVDGAAVDSTAGLIAQLNTRKPGDAVTLTVIRDGAILEVVVTLKEWPEQQDMMERPRFERRPKPDEHKLPKDYFRRFFPGPDDDDDVPGSPFEQPFPRPFHR